MSRVIIKAGEWSLRGSPLLNQTCPHDNPFKEVLGIGRPSKVQLENKKKAEEWEDLHIVFHPECYPRYTGVGLLAALLNANDVERRFCLEGNMVRIEDGKIRYRYRPREVPDNIWSEKV